MATIAYLTDIEGQWHKLVDFAHDNPVVTLHGETIDVAADGIFVFGGDAIDRGPHARKIVRALLDAKRRMPERVVLLAGNRDINKLRLARELQGEFFYPLPAELRSVDRATLLRWIFRYTMGAAQAFSHRQAELATDDEQAVPTSFLHDVLPGGDIAEYLRLCQLAYRHGSSLFVHGGVTDESLGHVPDHDPLGTPDAWIAALNAWYASQMQAYYDHVGDNVAHPSWTPLIAYQAPTRFSRRNQTSVVYGRTTDAHNNPHLPDDNTLRTLTHAGIHRLVVGHTPMGDTPSILQRSDFELVCADNSYGPLERGTLLLFDNDGLRLRAQGKTDVGETVNLAFSLGRTATDVLIGQRDATTGLLVKGPTTDGRYLLQRFGENFALDQRALSEADLRKLVLTK